MFWGIFFCFIITSLVVVVFFCRGRDGRQAKGRERDKTAERDSETGDKEREMGKALK